MKKEHSPKELKRRLKEIANIVIDVEGRRSPARTELNKHAINKIWELSKPYASKVHTIWTAEEADRIISEGIKKGTQKRVGEK